MSLDKNVVMNERRIGSYEQFDARNFKISGCRWRRIDTRKIFTKKRIRSRRTLERSVNKNFKWQAW